MNAVDCVIKLAKCESDAIGFIPYPKYKEAHEKGNIFYQIENGEFVGFLIVGGFPSMGTTYIWQECIDKSARGYGSGRRLFYQLLAKCTANYVYQIKLNCAEDLESNLFWQSMGFNLVRSINPNNKRGRKINQYRYQLIRDIFTPQNK